MVVAKEVKNNQTITERTIKTSKRIVKLDVIRTFAILCIILCHTCEVINGMSKNAGVLIVMGLIHTVSRLGVPMFLFLSGVLILRKNIETDKDIKEFYKKNLLPLIIANTIWVILYNLFDLLMKPKAGINVSLIIKELFFLEMVPFTHMWYIPMIIGIYIAMPFIAKLIKTFSIKSMKVIIIFVLISTCIIPNINSLLSIFGIRKNLTCVLNLNFLGGIFGIYIILGYYIYNWNLNKIDTKWTIIIGMFSFFVAFLQRMLLGDLWYNSLPILVCACCLFILFNKINTEKIENKIGKIFTHISKISLAVFFIHYIVIILIMKNIYTISMMPLIRFIVLYISTTVISIIVATILSKVKYVSKYALLIQ